MVAHMVFDIAAADVQFGIGILEFAEDRPWVLAHDIGQDVEPAAMGHADDDIVDALGRGLFNGLIEERDEGLRPFQGKGLGADEFFLDELLEDHRIGQPFEDPDLLSFAQD